MSVRYTNFKGTTLQLPFFFECFACMLVCVPHMYSAREGQMRVFDPLEAGVTHVGHRNQILKKSSQCSKPQNPLSPVLNSNLKLDTFNPSTHEAESSGVWSQPGLPNKLQARHGYIVRPCRGRKKKRETWWACTYNLRYFKVKKTENLRLCSKLKARLVAYVYNPSSWKRQKDQEFNVFLAL